MGSTRELEGMRQDLVIMRNSTQGTEGCGTMMLEAVRHEARL